MFTEVLICIKEWMLTPISALISPCLALVIAISNFVSTGLALALWTCIWAYTLWTFYF
jgi:hypothetical protein